MLHWGGGYRNRSVESKQQSGVWSVGYSGVKRGQRKLNMIQMLSGGAGYETKGR